MAGKLDYLEDYCKHVLALLRFHLDILIAILLQTINILHALLLNAPSVSFSTC